MNQIKIMGDQKEKQKKVNSKKKTTKGVRNVLAVPYENYWPTVTEEDGLKVKENLKTILPGLKRPQNKIPWTELKKLSKEERLEKKKSLLQNNEQSQKSPSSENIIFGVNAVTRQLEKNNLCSVLLDSTVDPPFLIKHIVTMAAHKDVPVILVPFLSSIMLESLKFSAIAVGFKKAVTESSDEFHETHRSIVQLSNNFLPPKTVIDSRQTFINDTFSSSEDDKMECEVETNSDENKIALSTNVYLYRNSKTERSFVPGKLDSRDAFSMETDFIAMPSSDDESDCEGLTLSSMRYHDICKTIEKKETEENEEDCYVPLKVKRVQGNANRTKATKAKKKKLK